jgi:hypothetical protein
MTLHPDFRLFVCLESGSFYHLPGSLLTAAVVLALEPPRTVKAHVMRCYQVGSEFHSTAFHCLWISFHHLSPSFHRL